MKKRTRWIVIGAALAAALLVIGSALSGSAVEVDTARLERGTLDVAVTEEGQTRVRERYVVSAPVSGLLTRIALDEGDAVAEGALLARIYPAPENTADTKIARAQISSAQARRSEAAARVDEIQARVAQLERDVERSRTLLESAAISQTAFEDAELAVAAARQQLEAARASIRAADADVDAARAALAGVSPDLSGSDAVDLHAPIGGRVLRVLEKSRRVVPAGTPLLELGDPGQLELVVDVLSEQAVAIRPGNRVSVEDWGGAPPLHGSVRLVEPDAFTEVSALGVKEQRVNVVVDLSDAPSSLGAGYRVEANIITWTGENVAVVPTSALFQENGRWQAFAVQDDKAALRSLEIGHRSADMAEVISGLADGESVILFPDDQIREGVSVQPRRR